MPAAGCVNAEVAPRAPVRHRAGPKVPAERFRARLDARHVLLVRAAQTSARTYRAMRAPKGSDPYLEARARFLAAIARLGSFEGASSYLADCRYNTQLAGRADEVTRQFFVLRQVIGRHGIEPRPIDESGWRRLDYFAAQLGRLEGLADALAIAGRSVRRFPLPALPWLELT